MRSNQIPKKQEESWAIWLSFIISYTFFCLHRVCKAIQLMEWFWRWIFGWRWLTKYHFFIQAHFSRNCDKKNSCIRIFYLCISKVKYYNWSFLSKTLLVKIVKKSFNLYFKIILYHISVKTTIVITNQMKRRQKTVKRTEPSLMDRIFHWNKNLMRHWMK